MPAPEEISKLVERYTNNRKQYLSSSYREADVRLEFLDPLFKALDWDVDNTQGNAPQYRDVVTEESLEVEGSIKTPDYSFRLSGTTKFFVEAKKPSVDICSDKMPAFQLKRYAWSAKLPLSILTNFEDISVYDCRYKPVKNDDPTKGRIIYIPFTELEERWDELVAIFTKDAILKGSFDKYAQAKKRGTSEVDAEILKEIEGWREELAKNIARNNEFTTEQVNFAVQRLIDRILFLRICEDRKTEPENQLYDIMMNKKDIYRHMIDVFQLADAKYNSGLFHFTHDKSRSTKPDRLMHKLIVDDKVLANILWDLYYPNSPYQFDVIPADILGQVYEQFLGKVIKLSASGKTAKVEEKPEVKKAGGVYYTPTYIVEYIVDNTVSKLCEGKNLEELAKVKILDPACGSGSFLIVAYQKMLDKHLEWYMANKPKNHKDQVFQKREDEWQLTLQEKKRILLNNIHGVDIDSQAVEVTKLNLLLKALEGESKESIGNVRKWFREPALPDLGSNIKCGNSLIDFDIIDHLQDLSDDERDNELNRINPFSWQEEFSEIMKAGGFDAVVGNPPYVRQESLGDAKEYFKTHYQTYHGMADLYTYFIEKGVNLLNDTGLWGNIVANKWMRANYGTPLRKWLKENHIVEILDFGDLKVFTTATTYPCIMIVGKGKPVKKFDVVNFKTLEPNKLNEIINETKFEVNVKSLDDTGWALMGKDKLDLLNKLKKAGTPLGEYDDCKIYYGIKTGFNEAFVVDEETKDRLIKEDKNSADLIKPFLVGKDIKSYVIEDRKRYLIFTRRGIEIDNYPAIRNYLEQFKERLMPKPKDWKGAKWKGRKQGSYEWYEIQDPIDYHEEFEKIKISFASIVRHNSFYLDKDGYFSNDKTNILTTGDAYLLGILNSKVLNYFIRQIASTKQGGYFECKPMYANQLPIKAINFDDPKDVARHDKMVKLVERMLKLHKDIKEASTPDAETRVQRQIEAADREIDNLVYELYGLSEEEIGIVEGSNE